MINGVKMDSINNKQYKYQLYTHHKSASRCDELHKHLKSYIQDKLGNCSCTDYSDRLYNIETTIEEIKTGITDITTRLKTIEENIKELLDSIINYPPPTITEYRRRGNRDVIVIPSCRKKCQ